MYIIYYSMKISRTPNSLIGSKINIQLDGMNQIYRRVIISISKQHMNIFSITNKS
jgi:hypothetical protein